MVDIEKIKEQVVNKLKDQLPAHLTYHSVDHTIYVYDKVLQIGRKEGVTAKELNLLKIAALYHDTGFIKGDKDHEITSCKIAREELKDDLSQEDIKLVCGMIMATKIPQSPQTYLEGILADADLEYLGTNNFQKTGNLLFLELQYSYPDLDLKRWNEIQIDFMSKHSYHTRFCKQYKEKYKQKHLKTLMSLSL